MKRLLTDLLRHSAHFKALFFLLLSLGFLALPRTAVAQQDIVADEVADFSDLCDFGFDCEVESVAIIFDTSTASQLNVLSETDVNLDALEDGWAAYDCGEVDEDNTDLADGCADDDGSGTASLSAGVPINALNGTFLYTVFTDSSVADVLDDPSACDDEDPEFCFEITVTAAQVVIGPIGVTGVSPNLIAVGTSGTLTITGQNLVNPFGGPQSDVQTHLINGTGSGFTVSNPNFNPDGSGGTVSFQADQNATVGQWDIGISYVMGGVFRTSTNEGSLIVGYPPASVSNVTPQPWLAGQSYKVTITGQNFGPSPTLTISGTGVTLLNFTPNANGQSIQATVNVAQNAPSNPNVIVDVTPGYNGPFVCACTGSPDGTFMAQTQAVTPIPQIMFNDNNISGTTQPVFAGQQIALSVPTPPGYNILSQSWTISGARVGGFTNSAGTGPPSNTAGGKKQGDPALNQSSLTIYWVNPGDVGNTVNFTYNLDNGQSASATATFSIQGPTGLPTVTVLPNGDGIRVVAGPKVQILGVPYQNGVVGATFTTAAAAPAGVGAFAKFMFLQIINNVDSTVVSSVGQVDLQENPPSGLDGTYPYFNGSATGTYDSPSSNLPSIYGELYHTFDATMYSLWDPGLPSGCHPANTSTDGQFTQTPSDCTSIPVPLGSVRWRWNGCAINTLLQPPPQTDPLWILSCGFSQTYTAQAADYPTWTATVNPLGH